jgi:hypothetical protein
MIPHKNLIIEQSLVGKIFPISVGNVFHNRLVRWYQPDLPIQVFNILLCHYYSIFIGGPGFVTGSHWPIAFL